CADRIHPACWLVKPSAQQTLLTTFRAGNLSAISQPEPPTPAPGGSASLGIRRLARHLLRRGHVPSQVATGTPPAPNNGGLATRVRKSGTQKQAHRALTDGFRRLLCRP